MKTLISTLFLGAGLVLGGCGNKEEELVFRQLNPSSTLEQRDEDGSIISEVEDFGWYTLITSHAHKNKNQLAKSTYVYLLKDGADIIKSTLYEYDKQDKLIKQTNFYTYRDKENKKTTKIDSMLYKYNKNGELIED